MVDTGEDFGNPRLLYGLERVPDELNMKMS